MADWRNSVITERGRNLDAKVRAGRIKMEFTKFKFGSGQLDSYESATDLAEPRLNIGITSIETVETGVTEVSTTLTNANVTTGFNMREVGLFAKDPDLGEILYLVMTDPSYDFLPAKGGATVISVDFSIFIGVDDAGNTTAVLDPNGLLKLRDLTAHNNNTDAHSALFTTDSTPATDAGTSSSLISKLGARVKWVKSYVTNKINDALKTVDTKISEALAAYRNFKASQISDFAEAVLIAIRDKTFTTLGVTWSFTNPNAWYICFGVLFGGLIIQGGWNIIPERQVKTIPFPINFTNKAFKPLIAWDDPAQGANPSWQFVAGATADTTSLQIGLHTQNGEGERGVNWLVAGI
mgnify:CR=1 FL=1